MDEPVVEKEPPIPVDNDISKDKELKKIQKKNKEDKSNRKKDEKSIDQVLKALGNLGTPEEKLAAMCKKYAEIFDEGKRQQMTAKVAEKKLVSLQREKEQLQAEQSKSVLTRSRLENLCRELQRQNKAMKEESLLRIREEEEKRREVSAKFQTALADITSLMQQNTESNTKLRDENLDMQNKFKSVCEQYELREQQVDKISKQMKLESQLADAKLRKAKMEMLAEKEVLERDKQQLMAEIALCQAKLLDHEKTEEALRAQINVYFEKYDEFQNVLTKSNQVYAGFKGEMEKMSKKITRLEKETSTWKQKWEGSHKALLQLAAEKQMKDAEVQLQARQLAQLQKLCRSLQTERTALLQQLKSLGIPPAIEDCNIEKEVLEPTKKTDNDTPKPEKSTSVPPTPSTSSAASDTISVEISPPVSIPKEDSVSCETSTVTEPNEPSIPGASDERPSANSTSTPDDVLLPTVNSEDKTDTPIAQSSQVLNSDSDKTVPQSEENRSVEVVDAQMKSLTLSDTSASEPVNESSRNDNIAAVSVSPQSSIVAESPAPVVPIPKSPGDQSTKVEPASSPSSDKKNSTSPTTGKGASSPGEHKKGKEGGRRRKK